MLLDAWTTATRKGYSPVAISPANAEDTAESSPLQIQLEDDSFTVASANGQEIDLRAVTESEAESVYIGYSTTDGASYVRTVSNYSGPQEEPLFEANEPGGSNEPELADPGAPPTEQFIPLNELPEVDPDLMQLGTVIAVNANSASLTWSPPEGTENVTVLLDGRQVSDQETSVRLERLVPDTVYEVTVGYSAGEGDEQNTIREDLHMIHTLPTDIGNPLKSKEVAKEISTLASYTAAQGLRLVTFLTDEFYDAGWMGGLGCLTPPSWKFAGDNRGYSTPVGPTTVYYHPSFRTGLEIIALLQAPPAYQGVVVNKAVGITKRYDSNGVYQDQKQAADTGMVVQNPTVSAYNYVKFGVSHEVGDPYCWAGKIRYSLPLVEIFDSGTITISGSRQPVPTFEFYGAFTNSSGNSYWATMYRAPESGLGCLLGWCISENISATHTAH